MAAGVSVLASDASGMVAVVSGVLAASVSGVVAVAPAVAAVCSRHCVAGFGFGFDFRNVQLVCLFMR